MKLEASKSTMSRAEIELGYLQNEIAEIKSRLNLLGSELQLNGASEEE